MVSLRRATADDIPFILATERLPGYDVLVGRFDEEIHRAHLADNGWLYFIGKDDAGAAGGFAILEDRGRASGDEYLRRIAVTNAGAGFGKQFLTKLIEWVFAETPAQRLRLHVRGTNVRARHVYTALGFVEERAEGDGAFMVLTRAHWSLKTRLAKPRFPRSSQYDPMWIVDNLMGPHVLWLAEHLSEKLALKPGMRILDLGCGKAISSIFFAKEFGVHVTACDLWIAAEDNAARIAAAGLSDRIAPVHAEAHALPFDDASFDTIVSLDAYHYFGTDDLYLGTPARLLKPGGRLGIVCPGVTRELEAPPPHLARWWQWEFCSFHTPDWWRRHWSKTGLLTVETADWMPDGKALWSEWNRTTAPMIGERGALADAEADMLDADTEGLLGFVRAVARKE